MKTLTIFPIALALLIAALLFALLDRAIRVKMSLRRKVSGRGFFDGSKRTKISLLAVDANSGVPSLSTGINAKHSRFAACSGALNVLLILRTRSWSEVCESIIRFGAIDVIKLFWRPFAGHVEPCEAVRHIGLAVDHDPQVSKLLFPSVAFSEEPAGYAAEFAVGIAGRSALPNEQSGGWIVVKQFAQSLRRKIGLSHEAPLLLTGQRLGGDDTLAGPRYLIPLIAVVAGCSSVGPTAEQLKEMANSQSSMCVTGAAWNGSPLTVHYTSFGGKSTGTAGGGGKVSCGASTAEFTNEGRMAPAPSTTAPATVVVPINVVPTLKVTP